MIKFHLYFSRTDMYGVYAIYVSMYARVCVAIQIFMLIIAKKICGKIHKGNLQLPLRRSMEETPDLYISFCAFCSIYFPNFFF